MPKTVAMLRLEPDGFGERLPAAGIVFVLDVQQNFPVAARSLFRLDARLRISAD